VRLTDNRVVGLAFRISSPRYGDLRRTVSMSRTFPGRFNTALLGAIYASREPQTAIEELRRRAARDGVSLGDMHPRSIFVLDLALQAVVDLTTPEQLDAWGLTPNDLADESMERCREVAEVAAEAGAEAIRWPSATGVGQSFAIFLERLRSGSRVKIATTMDVTRQILAALERGESVLQLLSALADLPLVS
jgi:RES domain-containing protein